jgi:helicase required for RNAi-mediated heterochromatin assembly 1
MNAHLSEKIGGRHATFSDDHKQNMSGDLNLVVNADIRSYVQKQDSIVIHAPEGHWTGKPEIPTVDEIILNGSIPHILPNKRSGAWKTKDKYLKAHYQLLREDAVGPLREAVEDFERNPAMMDNQKIAIYEKVHIVGFSFTHMGIAARVRFSTRRAQARILWPGSRRLVSGTIVALCPAGQDFKVKCVVAVVAARPLRGVELPEPEIDLFFFNAATMEIDSQQEWIMIESKTGYFEAHRHTLRALQKMDQEQFSQSKHLCLMDPAVEPPTYLQEDPVVDLSPVSGMDSETGYGKVDIINQWPGPQDSTMDSTQWESLKEILTKSLAVVQGPPGTGKTYVSKVALEVLLRNMKEDDPPIIIAAQTNHALDQLLSFVSGFESNYIRLGGRSTDIEIKKRALYEIRKEQRINLLPGSLLGSATINCTQQSKALIKILAPFHQVPTSPPTVEVFRQVGAITDKQAHGLITGSSRWISADDEMIEPLSLWAQGALTEFDYGYSEEQFGFDEEDEDLEIEQLREQEAEAGVNDAEDDQDILHGQWCSVENHWTVATPTDTDIKEATAFLDTVDDLWRLPEGIRGAVYWVMMQRLKDSVLKRFREHADLYNKNVQKLKIGKWERDAVYLSQTKVIGLTTTGLSKYRPLISSLKPKIVLIEEAAEVLEAPITVACMESVQQLILVGDHEQLQGHCAVHELQGEPYNLGVSLFERLVLNEMPYTTLLSQRRMHPDFRKLLSPIYPSLRDHETVLQRQKREWGMPNKPSYFFDHRWYESKDALMSIFNEQEAAFIAGFYRWLVLNGIPVTEVTILTLYNGQRKRILKEVRKYPELAQVYNRVKTVDSYQGEENTIVLLSLARHNDDNQIGFLSNRNRACVALSRAREGFYIFGSTKVLARDDLWMSVAAKMRADKRLSSVMPLVCKMHGNRVNVSHPEDWPPIGGCHEKCTQILPCGHPCQLHCHPFSHDQVHCVATCAKTLVCGHKCDQKCTEECDCACDAFAEACRLGARRGIATADAHQEQQAVKVESVTKWMDGRYVSDTSRPDGSLYYLPEQVKDNPVQRGGRMVGVKTQDIRNGRSNPLSQSPPASGDNDGIDLRRKQASPAKQAERKREWQGFAQGGAKHSDEMRDAEFVQKAQSLKATRKHVQPGPRNQTSVELGNNRQKYTEDFVPGRVTTNGVGNGATVRSGGGAGEVEEPLIDFD